MPDDLSKSHRARKRFGQNFLSDHNIIDKIVRAINPQPDDIIIEIGPGLGAITEHLLNSGSQLTAIEIDRDLASHLRSRFPQLTLVENDALKTDFGQLLGNTHKAKFVGNLPYNISTPIIFHLLDFAKHCGSMHFMLQKEVVDRMAATPDSKQYGKLSIMVQYQCEVRPLFHIPPTAFNPAPKVDSTLVQLIPRIFPHQASDRHTLEKLVSSAFSQRRKTLRNALKANWSEQLVQLPGHYLAMRAEQLSIDDYVTLSNILSETNETTAS